MPMSENVQPTSSRSRPTDGPAGICLLREINVLDPKEIGAVARLHAQVLDFGPMSGLGEEFVRKIGYELPLRSGLLRVTLALVDGLLAGFIAYSLDSRAFQRDALRRHRSAVVGTLLRSLWEDPRRLLSLMFAARVILSRNRLEAPPGGTVGEFAALAVRTEYTTVEFYRRTRFRVGEELTKHVITVMKQSRIDHVRGFVDAPNKAALLMYRRLGARFTPCTLGGRPMIQASFDLSAVASQ